MSDPQMNELFLAVMRNIAASVTVVTATNEGRHHGLTVSAFSSVSLDPPLVLVCIDKSSTSLAALHAAGAFTVNFLSSDAGEVAMQFASKDEDKFATISHRAPNLPDAGPWLADAAFAYFECETVQVVEAGDHDVFIGKVHHGERINMQPPLVYWNRGFPKFAAPESP